MAKLIDLTGQKFGHLIVIEQAPSKNRHVYWKCQCDCGTICEKSGECLRAGTTLHCGCQLGMVQKKKRKEERFNRHVGERYGRLVVIANTGKRTATEPIWLCQCDCGNQKEVATGLLLSGHTKSCGCLKIGAHGPDLTGQKYGKLYVIKKDPDNPNKWICQCDCGNIKSITGYNIYTGATSSCGCINYSIGEYNIRQILLDNNIEFCTQYHPKDGYGYYDFAIFKNNNLIHLIEFDGEQHYKENRGAWKNHESLEKIQERDKMKNEYALSHNIPLVRIPYWMRDKITLNMLLGNEFLVKE